MFRERDDYLNQINKLKFVYENKAAKANNFVFLSKISDFLRVLSNFRQYFQHQGLANADDLHSFLDFRVFSRVYAAISILILMLK